MNIEDTLTEDLANVASSLVTPPPPAVADLVRQAEREKTRTRRIVVVTSGLVAAAVLGAVLLGSQLGKPDAGPGPSTHLPTPTTLTFRTGAPLKTWTDTNSMLYIDGVQVAGSDWAGEVTTGDLTTVEKGPYDTGETGVFIGTQLAGMVHDVAIHEIPVSPDHRTIAFVAFTNTSHTKAAIIVARVSDDGVEELGRLPLASLLADGDDESHERLLNVADDGTVLYGGVVGGHSWKPGGQPKDADITTYEYGPTGFPNAADDVHLNSTGTWGAWMTDVTNPNEAGAEVMFTTLVFQKPNEPATRTRIKFGDQYDYVNLLYWEGDSDLILYAGHRDLAAKKDYLRCSVESGQCEVAPRPGTF